MIQRYVRIRPLNDPAAARDDVSYWRRQPVAARWAAVEILRRQIYGTPRDFCELLELFNAHDVKAIIVDAYALAFHGMPRTTGDLDLLVEPSPANAERVMRALEEFGFGAVGLSAADFQKPDVVTQLGHPPVRVDLLTSISGLTWAEAWSGRVTDAFGGVPAAFLGLDDLRRNKRAVGRHKDLADLEALGED